MPAAAVIPALLVYINAAAFKAPVVAFIVPIRNLERSLPTYTIHLSGTLQYGPTHQWIGAVAPGH